MKMQKHAFLVMAHTQPNLLKRLLKSLDHNRVDIFLHIDKKSKIDVREICGTINNAGVYLVDRILVNWGGYSTVQAELSMLETAVNTGYYRFYHFISGQDYLLKSIEDVLFFFDNSGTTEYISFKNNEVVKYIDRLRLIYPFQESVGRTRGVLYYVQRILTSMQRRLKIYRSIPEVVGFGSAFFDISDDFARYIVKTQNDWKTLYKNTLCADELFVQTLFTQYSNGEKALNEQTKDLDYYTINASDRAILRAIDWKRGNPYIWRVSDYDFLIKSDCLFARKVDEKISESLLDLIDINIQHRIKTTI